MALTKLFNENWQFHLGELSGIESVKKYAIKAAMCGGVSQVTEEEGNPLKKTSMRDMLPVLRTPVTLCGEWREVELPHDWMHEQEYKKPCDSASLEERIEADDCPGYLPRNVGYYRKVFTVPQEFVGMRICVEFEGVMHDCDLWINGHYLGHHYSGYTSFDYDLTEYLFDEPGWNNALLVKTSSYGDEGWWYEGAGIYRDVWLKAYACPSVKRDGLWARVDEIGSESASGAGVITVQNPAGGTKDFRLQLKIADPYGTVVFTGSATGQVASFSTQTLSIAFTVSDPKLWNLETRYLYTCTAEIEQEGHITDIQACRFGIRSAEYRRDGFYLNGRKLELKGVCEHQDFAGVGIALNEDILRYKIMRMKQMGANAYRSSHHPATRKFLDLCDEMGMLVLNENRFFSVNPDALKGIEDLVNSSRNHPCVFMYCLENEELIPVLEQGRRMLRRLRDYLKNLDPTRPITMAGFFAKDDPRYIEIADVAGFNYDATDAAIHVRMNSELKVMATEDASFCSTRGIFEDDKAKGFCSAYDTGAYPAFHAFAAMTPKDVGTFGGAKSSGLMGFSWPHVRYEVPELGGLFLWTAMDYRGECFPWNWPQTNCHYGAMDLCGFAKDAYHYWESVWLDEPMVHVLPHWTLPGKEGQDVEINTYSNCDEVEVFVNGNSLGRQSVKRGIVNSFLTVYNPGELKAVAYRNGTATAECVRKTFGNAVRLGLETIYSGKELQLVKVTAYDAQGLVCENCCAPIRVDVENGVLVGTGNGNPANHTRDTLPELALFNGLALLIVRTQKDCKLCVRSEFEPCSLYLA